MATGSHSYGLRLRLRASSSAKAVAAQEKEHAKTAAAVPATSAPSADAECPIIKLSNHIVRKRTSKVRKSANACRGEFTTEILSKEGRPRRADRTANGASAAGEPDLEDFRPRELHSFGEGDAASIRPKLLDWYDDNHRVLPWRQNSHSRRPLGDDADVANGGLRGEHEAGAVNVGLEQQRAYEVWISEVMLQQTRVATVVLYYHNWMAKWPTLQDLALASLEDVYRVWAGLGYYRRAHFLLEGAKQIMEKHVGAFPESLSELRQVPGIGKYTAGAIASIAFNKAVPVVDGNIIRVLCRLRAVSDSPKGSRTIKLMWMLAEELVDRKRPGDLNQALMELGATVCTPRNPACSTCPIGSHCKALSLASLEEDTPGSVKSVTEFPTKICKALLRDEYVSVCVLEVSKHPKHDQNPENQSRILVMQRPKQGLLAGLWEFPSVSLGNLPVSREEQQGAMDQFLKETLGLDLRVSGLVKQREVLGAYVHLFSHIRWHMSIEWLLLSSSGGLWEKMESCLETSRPIQWVLPGSVGALGLTTSVRKIYEMYVAHVIGSNEEETGKRCPRTKRSKSMKKTKVL